jgi:hypothetical protein
MSPGRVKVSTEELHGAAQVLTRVGTALTQQGDLGVGAKDVGSAELAGAIADFCQKAGNLSTLFSATIGAAAATTEDAGNRYERIEHANLAAFGGRP